ncbi:hypothetical protein L6259_02170 [Candidatus Parcubacteria bacterium]|nr:hypothetical protein [Candidatus Parcubacteria bacterium]
MGTLTENWFAEGDLLGRSYSKPDGSTEHWSAGGGLFGRSYTKKNGETEHFSTGGSLLGRSYLKAGGVTEHWNAEGSLTGRSFSNADGSTEHRSASGSMLGRSYGKGRSFPVDKFNNRQQDNTRSSDEKNVCSFSVGGGCGGGEIGFIGITVLVVVAAGFLVVYIAVEASVSFLMGLKKAIDQGIEEEHWGSLSYYNMMEGTSDENRIKDAIFQDKLMIYLMIILLVVIYGGMKIVSWVM